MRVVDQAAEGWPRSTSTACRAAVASRLSRLLSDTLDSYHLVAKTDAERARQEAGMVRVIQAIKARYPDAKLLFNRGFDPAADIFASYGVVFESLFRGWNQAQRLHEVSQQDRDWLLNQARIIRDQYKLPVISIDYCPPAGSRLPARYRPPHRRAWHHAICHRSWLQTVGVGRIEVMPRRVLVVQERREVSIDDSAGVRFVSMPLNYLGYRVDFAETRDTLPRSRPTAMPAWWSGQRQFSQNPAASGLDREADRQGIPVAFMNGFGACRQACADAEPEDGQGPPGGAGADRVAGQDDGLRTAGGARRVRGGAVQVDDDGRHAFSAAPARRAADVRRRRHHAVGRLREPAVRGVRRIPPATRTVGSQPLDFLREALRLPRMPVPDTTTESGAAC
jgi:hypothetical protein